MPTIKIATFNCNSVRMRLPIVLDWLKANKPDVLSLQETKVVDADFPKKAFEDAGWNVAFKGQKGYNGVALVSKKPLEDVAFGLDPKRVDEEEARLIWGRLGDVWVYNTYVPQGYEVISPKFQKKMDFFKNLKAFFAQRVKKDTPALWMGDINVAPTEIDLWDPKRNAEHVCFHPRARAAYEDVRGDLWTDLFRLKETGPGHYTFWDYLWPANFEKNRGWRIDLILGTPPMAQRLKKIWIDKEPRTREKPSDHTFLVGEFSV